MEAEILKMAASQSASQGFFAVLFVSLLFYVLRENSRREAKYQSIINELTAKFDVVNDIREDVKQIKNKIYN